MGLSGYQKINRITCDIDTLDFYALRRCVETFLKYGFNKDMTIKKSPSKQGYHVIAWADRGVTMKKLLKIREEAGDDIMRCILDAKSGRQIQVLFDFKKKYIEE